MFSGPSSSSPASNKFYNNIVNQLNKINEDLSKVKDYYKTHEYIREGDLAKTEGLDPIAHEKIKAIEHPEEELQDIKFYINEVTQVAQKILNNKKEFESLTPQQKAVIEQQLQQVSLQFQEMKETTNQLTQLIDHPSHLQAELNGVSKQFMKTLGILGYELKKNDIKKFSRDELTSAIQVSENLRSPEQKRLIIEFNRAFNKEHERAVAEADKLHEAFARLHPEVKDLQLDPQTRTVTASAATLKDVFTVALGTFPELISLVSTPAQNSKIIDLIQTILIGRDKMEAGKKTTDLPYANMGFVIAETKGKEISRPLGQIPAGQDVPENIIMYSEPKSPVAINNPAFRDRLTSCLHRFINDAVLRKGSEFVTDGNVFPLGNRTEDDKYDLRFLDAYRNNYLNYLDTHPESLADIETQDRNWVTKFHQHFKDDDNTNSLFTEGQLKDLLLVNLPPTADPEVVNTIAEKLRVPEHIQQKFVEAGMSPEEAESILRIQFLKMAITMQQSLAASPLGINIGIGQKYNLYILAGTQSVAMSYIFDAEFDQLDIRNHYNFTTPTNVAEKELDIPVGLANRVNFATFDGTVSLRSLSLPSQGQSSFRTFQTLQNLEISYWMPASFIDYLVAQYQA